MVEAGVSVGPSPLRRSRKSPPANPRVRTLLNWPCPLCPPGYLRRAPQSELSPAGDDAAEATDPPRLASRNRAPAT